MFIGKDGLRAGWSLLIYVVILVAIGFSVTLIAQKIHPRPNPSEMAKITQNVPPRFLLLNEAIPFFMVLLVTWIMSKIERRPNSVYGFGGSRKLTHFLAGLAWGVTCLSLLVLILWKTRFLVIDSRLVFGSDILRYGAIWLFGFLLVGLFEEYLLRGYLQYTLSRGLTGLYQAIFKSRHSTALGFWTAALLLSTLFGLGHGSNPGESPIGLLSAGLAGLLFCFALWRTGSLWWAIGFHTSWDWAQSFLYGVADSGMMVQHHLLATHAVGKPILSGGATGPEGSIFVVVVFAVASVIIVFTLPRAHSGGSPKQSTNSNLASAGV
ncbi:MAG TPA: CPBP family intramembrane glutamic endopeptidase [Candidatus Sulfotelmatobacter sp.]|nr:CPBP family intramembrane glutamic endopeptidase [Candidatus Sulfotelmatobacter sp.]